MKVCVDTNVLVQARSIQHPFGVILVSGNLVMISQHYQFHIIGDDLDDNAFTDCAIAAHADFVITEDLHFAPLADAGYYPQPITPQDFGA